MLESAPTVREELQEVAQLDAAELARTVVFAIEDRKGEDIVMMDLRALTPIADYFVIATADNERLLRALMRTVEAEVAEQHNMKPYHSEGSPESGWILLDYSWVMVHLFSRQQRAFYHLDELWDDAPVVLRIQ